jgi:hypothetical protein
MEKNGKTKNNEKPPVVNSSSYEKLWITSSSLFFVVFVFVAFSATLFSKTLAV